MTMVPARNASNNKKESLYGRVFIEESSSCVMNRLEGGNEFSSEVCLGSDLVVGTLMADQDESRTNSVNEAGCSSSKEVQEDHRDEGWLQLSIGGAGSHHCTSTSTETRNTSTSHQDSNKKLRNHGDPMPQRGNNLIELDLLPGANSSQPQARHFAAPPMFNVPEFRAPRPLMPPPITNFTNPISSFSNSSLFFHQQQQQHHHGTSPSYPYLRQDINWAFGSIPQNIVQQVSPSNSSTSSSSLMLAGSYLTRPVQLSIGVDVAGPSSGFRIVDAPRRPHSGIWFMLQASQNQAREPFFPQISKSYLRIKDGRMQVRLITKYLANKLSLDSESEIEITCRGQQLLPFLTLQHVRDNIWSPKDLVTLLPDSSTTDHVMVLHYGRSA